jgi:hypothetical protein
MTNKTLTKSKITVSTPSESFLFSQIAKSEKNKFREV